MSNTDEEHWARICRVEDIPQGFAWGGEVDGRLVCAVLDGDRPQVMLDRCPHRDIRLSGGLVRDGLLTCPGHFWRFDLTDGHRTDEPNQVCSFYPTRTDEEGWVWALLPAVAQPMGMREWLLAQARESRHYQGGTDPDD